MPLWDRFTRMVKANVGRILDDPLDKSGAGRKLDQRLKELRARDTELKALDERIITLKGHATFLERKLEKLKRKEAEQDARARAATAHGAGMTATNHEIDLGDTRREIAQVEAELTGARSGLERAEVQKRALVEEKATRLAAAQEALLEAEHESQQGPPPLAPRSAPSGAAPPAPAPPLGPEPPSSGPRIKITPRGAPEEPPRKTIGPEAGRVASGEPASADASSSSSLKTLGPGPEPASPAPDASGASSGRSTKSLGPAAPEPAAAPAPAVAAAAPAGVAAAAPPGGDRLLDELERLGKLLEAGAISAEEFAAAKKKLLGA